MAFDIVVYCITQTVISYSLREYHTQREIKLNNSSDCKPIFLSKVPNIDDPVKIDCPLQGRQHEKRATANKCS